MLHVTHHFDAGDIDKFNESPFRRTNIVYHAKKRFKSPEVNMHYTKTFDAVGTSTGDKELDNMRFRTTNRAEHSPEKVSFVVDANPKTVYEQMAKQSRRKMNLDGKPRGLLAHVDFGKRGSASVKPHFQDAGLAQTNRGQFATISYQGDLPTSGEVDMTGAAGPAKARRNSVSTMLDQPRCDDWVKPNRYATHKKLRRASDNSKSMRSNLVDVHYQRELKQREERLLQQL